MGALEETSIDENKGGIRNQLFWRSKGDSSSDTYDEKAGRGYNSEHNVFGCKSIFSTKLTIPCN